MLSDGTVWQGVVPLKFSEDWETEDSSAQGLGLQNVVSYVGTCIFVTRRALIYGGIIHYTYVYRLYMFIWSLASLLFCFLASMIFCCFSAFGSLLSLLFCFSASLFLSLFVCFSASFSQTACPR